MRVVVVVLSLVALTVMAVGALWANADRTDRTGLVDAGRVDRLEDRGVTYIGPARAYVVSTRNGLVALYARSPQLGEPVKYCRSSGWFEDPMHGSKFDRAGHYVLGPAPRGLDRFTLQIEGDEAFVDTTEILLGPPRGANVVGAAGPFCTGVDR
jgi:hypothetical protein